MKKRLPIIILIIGLMLLILACGGDSEIEVSSSSGNTVKEEPTQAPIGTSRDNPAPRGSEVTSDDMKFVISDSTRPADHIVSAANMFNTEPEAGQEYLFINLQITCMKSSNEECSVDFFNIEAVGTEGVVYNPEWFISGVDGLLESTEFYGGTTISGNIPFIVSINDTGILLKYEPFWGDTFYMSIQ